MNNINKIVIANNLVKKGKLTRKGRKIVKKIYGSKSQKSNRTN